MSEQPRNLSEEKILGIKLGDYDLLVCRDESIDVVDEVGWGTIVKLGPACHESLKVGDIIEFDTEDAVRLNHEKDDYLIINEDLVWNNMSDGAIWLPFPEEVFQESEEHKEYTNA